MTECKTCTKCKETKRGDEFHKNKKVSDGLQAHCKKCSYESVIAWRKANLERQKSTSKAYYEDNKERLNAENRAYHKSDREKANARSRAHNAKNPGKATARTRAWRKDNPERANLINGVADRKRRASKAGVRQGPVPTVQERLEKQGGMCANCKRKGKRTDWHLEHIVPITDEGAHAHDNIEVLCAYCNLSKGAKDPDKWELENGRLPLNFGAR